MKIKRLFFVPAIVFLLVTGGGVRGATYYISTSGDDEKTGMSPQEAWRSIEKVNGTDFAPGDSILFEGGETFVGGLVFDSGGRAEEPITIGSYGGGRATISSGDEKGFYGCDCGGFEIKDLIFVGSKNDKLDRWKHHGIQFQHSDGGRAEEHVYIDNVDVSGYMFGIEAGCRAENNIGFRDIRITNSEIHNNWDKAILIYGCFPRPGNTWANQDVYIADCDVHDNSGSASSPLLTGNGIELTNIQNGLVEFCETYNNGELCYSKTDGPIGISVWESDSVTIELCESHDNYAEFVNGCGYGIGGGARNCIAQYNYSHNNNGAGFLVWNGEKKYYNDTTNNTYRYNISERDGLKNGYGSITFGTSGSIFNTVIHNNTLYIGPWSTGACVVVWSGMTYNTGFRNNILLTAPGQKAVSFLYTSGSWNFQGNCYWSSGVPIRIDWGGKLYSSLTDFRAGTGQEMLGGSAVGFEADPQLVDAGDGQTIGDARKLTGLRAYKLQATSPLIDRGLDLWKLFDIDPGKLDFYGGTIPQGAGYDVGAYEYVEAPLHTAQAAPDLTTESNETGQFGYKLTSPLPFTVFRENQIKFQVSAGQQAPQPEMVIFHILNSQNIEAEEQKADGLHSYILDCNSLSDGRIFVKATVWHEGQPTVIGEGWDDRGVPIVLDRKTNYKPLTHHCKYIKPGGNSPVFMNELARQDFAGNNNQISFCSAWNEEFLYLAIWVKDEHLNVGPLPLPGSGMKDYNRRVLSSDGIGIRLDTNRDRGEWRQLDDFDLVVNIAGEYRGNRWDDRKQKFLRWGERVNIKTECNGTINDNQDKDKGYYLFIGIPWSELSCSPENRKAFGLDVECFDKDGEDVPFYVAWSGEKFSNSDNPSEWGNLVLTPKPLGSIYVFAGFLLVVGAAFSGYCVIRKVQHKGVLPTETTEQTSEEDTIVGVIKSFISENYRDPMLDREAIADYFNLSKDHISHLFKKETGVKINDYLNQIRIEHAKKLLKEKRLSVSEIAFEVGYNTIRHFNRTFKKITGQKPSEYH